MNVGTNLEHVRGHKAAVLAGDSELVKRQHDAGKLTARERVGLLFDEGSFVEIDALREDAGVVAGFGLVDGRPAYAYAQDFTVKSGSVGEAHARKVLKAMDMAEKTGAPIFALCDSVGARLDEGMAGVNAYASIMARSAALSGVIPQIALVLGPCGGGAAMCAEMSDLVLVGKNGALFVNGPQLVSPKATLESVGGAKASEESGAAHVACGTDEETIACARKLAALLPSNNLEDAPFAPESADELTRQLVGAESMTDARELARAIADDGDALELGALYAPEMVTLLARVGGGPVGFVATQSAKDEGRLTPAGCKKAARFVRFCDCFSIPLVVLADTMGPAISDAPQGDLMKGVAQLMFAMSDATCPRVSVVIGNAVSSAATVLASRAAFDAVYAWPGSVIAPIGAPAAVQMLYEKELHDAQDPVAKRAELEAAYQSEVADGLSSAKNGWVDDVIEPADTRHAIASALEMLAGKRAARPAKKHGNLPL